MSHQLRTPLNAILGFAQLMASESPPPPVRKESIDQILRAGWYLLELINEILDLALIESGKLSMSMEPLSLADVMLECQTMMEPQAHARGIHLMFPRCGDPWFVMGDRIPTWCSSERSATTRRRASRWRPPRPDISSSARCTPTMRRERSPGCWTSGWSRSSSRRR